MKYKENSKIFPQFGIEETLLRRDGFLQVMVTKPKLFSIKTFQVLPTAMHVTFLITFFTRFHSGWNAKG